MRNQLGGCDPVGRDLMVLTDWMAARMIKLGWIQPLDAAAVAHLHKNLLAPLRGRFGTPGTPTPPPGRAA